MKWVWLLVTVAMVASPIGRAAEANPNADGNAAWADIVKNSQPPSPPPEWNKTPPSAEQMVEFKHKAGDAAEALADKIKRFYESYPDHPKAAEAREREKSFRKQAVALHNASVPKPAEENAKAAEPQNESPDDAIDPEFKKKFFEAMARIRAARENGPPAVSAELEKSGRELARDFPKRPEPWEMIYTAAQYAPDPTNSLALFKEVAEKALDPRMRAAAAGEVSLRSRLGKPLALSYEAVDGRAVDVSKLKGKVVLVDFWATWCGPCIAELPHVLSAYDELHSQGFEIVGVSFDEDCDSMKKFTQKNKMAWPQFCDGGGWTNAINREFHISSIPAMFLLDKKGVLRDMNAREGLREKIKALLDEKEQ